MGIRLHFQVLPRHSRCWQHLLLTPFNALNEVVGTSSGPCYLASYYHISLQRSPRLLSSIVTIASKMLVGYVRCSCLALELWSIFPWTMWPLTYILAFAFESSRHLGCHGGSAIIYQQLPTHYTTYKIIPITPQPIPPTIPNEIPIKAYRK